MRKNIEALAIEKLGGVHPYDEGATLVTLSHSGEKPGEIGLIFPPDIANELTGALIEHPQSGYHRLASHTEQGQHFDVTEAQVHQTKENVIVVSLASENGPELTLRMSALRARRLRDHITALLVRREVQSRQ